MPRFSKGERLSKASSSNSSSRKVLGVFYTPHQVAIHAAKEALGRLTQSSKADTLLKLHIVDPSFGDGVFLRVALEYLTNKFCKETARNRKRLVGPGERKEFESEVRRHCLFGVDINPSTTHISTPLNSKNLHVGKNSLLSAWFPGSEISTATQTIFDNPVSFSVKQPLSVTNWAKEIQSSTAKRRLRFIADYWLALKLQLIDGSTLSSGWSDFAKETLNGDRAISASLENQLGEISTRYRFFHWQLEFPFLFSSPFDLVCGNPPWEVVESQSRQPNYLPPTGSYSRFLRETYSLEAGRRVELAATFVNLAFNIVHHKGIVSFLLPQAVQNAKTFESARRMASTCHSIFNRFDNKSGVFTDLDKRCDFTAMTVDFNSRGSMIISNSTLNKGESAFKQIDIPVRSESKRQLALLGGETLVIPDLKNPSVRDVVIKVLRQCSSLETLAKGEFDTWNGLNSTTDRELFKTTASRSNEQLSLLAGSDIHILSTLCRGFGKTLTASVRRSDLGRRGYSDIFGKCLWEVDRIGWRKISRLDDTRTIIASPIAAHTANIESLWTIAFLDSDIQLWLEFIWSSLVYDSLARGIVNANVSKFILLGLPVPAVDRVTLQRYKSLRRDIQKTSFESPEYFNSLRKINNLAFSLFGLKAGEIGNLLRGYYNTNHPHIQEIAGDALGATEVAA